MPEEAKIGREWYNKYIKRIPPNNTEEYIGERNPENMVPIKPTFEKDLDEV